MPGLSPRGRGNPISTEAFSLAVRSIPAWAGEPAPGSCWLASARVYPRVGGGTPETLRLILAGQGLSPRGRGNPPMSGTRNSFCRSIPAWAGEPRRQNGNRGGPEVYPRVGGGTLPGRHALCAGRGLSPRGRGNQPPPPGGVDTQRSIPAWAGEPSHRKAWQPTGRVYPRVGGGT